MRFDREFYRSKEWKEARAKRLKIDNYACTECNSKDRVQVHHRISPENGGSKTAMYNLQTLCYNHHAKKHNHMYVAQHKAKKPFKVSRF